MIRRTTTALLAAVLFFTADAGVVWAQTTDASLGISYSFLRILEDPSANLPAGWLISFAKPIDRSAISLVGEFGGNYRSEFDETLRVHTFQGGLRLSGRTAPGVNPFAQMLLGGMNIGCCGDSSTHFMIEPGFGVDLAMGRGVAFRGGISFPIAFGNGNALTTLRLHAGIVVPISSR